MTKDYRTFYKIHDEIEFQLDSRFIARLEAEPHKNEVYLNQLKELPSGRKKARLEKVGKDWLEAQLEVKTKDNTYIVFVVLKARDLRENEY